MSQARYIDHGPGELPVAVRQPPLRGDDPALGLPLLQPPWPWQAPGFVVTGPRVTVRRFGPDDLAEQVHWPVLGDPLLESYNHRLEGDDDTPALAYQRLVARSNYVRLALTQTSNGRLVGTLSLRDFIATDTRGERPLANPPAARLGVARLGLVIRGDCLGQGWGAAALQTFVAAYFGPMGFARLELDVAAVNTRAIRCYQRAGFRWIGRFWQLLDIPASSVGQIGGIKSLPQYARIHGQQVWLLHYDMALTAQEFACRHGVATSAAAPRSSPVGDGDRP